MKHYQTILLTVILCVCLPAQAELLLVANKSFELESLKKEEIIDLYMGRSKYIGNEVKVIPLDIKQDSIKEVFYRSLVNKSLREVNSYWARLLFSGRATPPMGLADSAEVIELIKRNPSAIGYIRESDLTDDVKVIGHVE